MSDVSKIAARANVIATQDGKRRFGAPCSKPQVTDVIEHLKGKQPLQVLKVKEATLRRYAAGEITGAELPKETKAALSEMVDQLPVRKYWARKVAAITVAVIEDRKRTSRKPRAKKQEVAA